MEMGQADRYVEKERTWQDNWNNVLRNVLFPDRRLKELMLIPEGTDIRKFREKYFIRDGSTDELLTTEKVRVVHHDDEALNGGHPHVRGKYRTFDIYVSEDEEFTCDRDRLRSRQVMVAERIKYLLLRKYNCENIHFMYEDEYDQWTKTVGYKMYKLTLFYQTSG